jgi:glutamate transport system permease protein
VNLIEKYGDQLISAFWTTVQLTVLSGLGALALGTILAAMRVSPVPVARWLGGAYVNTIRNIPLTLITLFCSFGLYQTLQITLAGRQSRTFLVDLNFRLALVALTAYTACFVCEALRSGINTVPVGQAEAGRSLGLTFSQNLVHVILPQAFRSVTGPLGSVVVALTKNTSLASVIGVAEASLLMQAMIENEADIFSVGAVFAVGFRCRTVPTGLLFGYLSKKMAVAR